MTQGDKGCIAFKYTIKVNERFSSKGISHLSELTHYFFTTVLQRAFVACILQILLIKG